VVDQAKQLSALQATGELDQRSLLRELWALCHKLITLPWCPECYTSEKDIEFHIALREGEGVETQAGSKTTKTGWRRSGAKSQKTKQVQTSTEGGSLNDPV
jgi:hypothetical protein